MNELPFPIDLNSVAVWLASGAGGVTIALLLNKWQAFKDWKSWWKGKLIVVLFIASPFAGEGLVRLFTARPDLVAVVQHYLGLALLGLAGWAASQFANQNDANNPKNQL